MGFFDKLKSGLDKTRKNFTERIEQLVIGYATIDDEFLDDLEAVLLSADVGVSTTGILMADIRQGIKSKVINSPDDLKPFLKKRISQMLEINGNLSSEALHQPLVILIVGVNGVGKTTTIGKLSHYYKTQGKQVLVAAGDTFRAAAIEQLEIWSSRTGSELIKHKEGADPAAVAFDAVQAAKARKTDILIIDTAGRLHTKSNLMEELKKIHRIIAKEIPEAPHETYLVLDATTGQNALSQAKLFGEAAKVTGVVLTKLDGTAKGGVVVAIRNELGLPVKWIGVGEGMDDLRPFHPQEFADALFGDK